MKWAAVLCKIIGHFGRLCSIARYRGLENVVVFLPGVCTPGFMLTPASQATKLMLLLTEDSVLICDHIRGIVQNTTTQDWVTIKDRRVLVEINPEGRTITGCPNYGVGIRPCVTTLQVQTGYSTWIRIDENRICLDTVIGLTDGTPPGVVNYRVRDPEQSLVEELP